MALTFASGSRAVPHSAADDVVHDAFMTLPAYSRSREGEVHALGFGVRNGSYTARSRPVEASRERMEREGPATSAEGTAGSRIPWVVERNPCHTPTSPEANKKAAPLETAR